MPEPLNRLRRTDQPAGAAIGHIGIAFVINFPRGGRATGRADMREGKGLAALWPLGFDNAGDLRNHIACALHLNHIADADVLAADFILIVKGGIGDNHTADIHRRELGHRGQHAGAPHLNFNVEQAGAGALSRKFMRGGPARRARNKAQPLLQGEIVNFIDHTVNIIAQTGASGLNGAENRQHFSLAGAALHQRVDRQAAFGKPLHHIKLALRGAWLQLAPGIGKKFQRPCGGDGGVKLAQ